MSATDPPTGESAQESQGKVPASTSGTPGTTLNGTTLNRAAIERVLARAAELQATEGTGEPTDLVSEAQLLEIAREVGLSTTSVRQAIAEERTRIPGTPTNDASWLTRVAGPNIVSAVRTVRGRPEDIMSALDSWLQREECLQVQRRFSDRVIWEPRGDWFNTLRRNLRIGGRGYHLCRADSVAATVIQIDDERVAVRLDADVTPRRAGQVRLSGVSAAGGVAFAGSLVTMGVVAHAAALAVMFAASIPLGLGAIGVVAALRQHRQLVVRVHLALEQVLDRLEFADARKPASLLDVVSAIRPLVR